MQCILFAPSYCFMFNHRRFSFLKVQCRTKGDCEFFDTINLVINLSKFNCPQAKLKILYPKKYSDTTAPSTLILLQHTSFLRRTLALLVAAVFFF